MIWSSFIFSSGVLLVVTMVIYAIIRHKYSLFELSRFATIAILIFALPRLCFILLAITCDKNIDLSDYKLEITLGISLLIIRCIAEIIKILTNDKITTTEQNKETLSEKQS